MELIAQKRRYTARDDEILICEFGRKYKLLIHQVLSFDRY